MRNLNGKRFARFPSRLSRGLDTRRLTALNPRPLGRSLPARRGLDTRRLTSLRNPRHFGRPMFNRSRMDTTRLMSFRRNLEPYSTTAYRYNPDRGPQLYNPLEDDNHEFKDDSHYEATIAKLRRNPDSECEYCPDCGLRRNPEEGSGLYQSIFSRNPDYALRAVTGVNSATGDPGVAQYRSLFARKNPPSSIQTASNDLIGQGLYKSIFSRNPIRRWKRRR